MDCAQLSWFVSDDCGVKLLTDGQGPETHTLTPTAGGQQKLPVQPAARHRWTRLLAQAHVHPAGTGRSYLGGHGGKPGGSRPGLLSLKPEGSRSGLEVTAGGGHGSPVQCSCLEGLTDRGAWQATGRGPQRGRLGGVTQQAPAHLAEPEGLAVSCRSQARIGEARVPLPRSLIPPRIPRD